MIFIGREKIKEGGTTAMYKKLYTQPYLFYSLNDCDIIVLSGTGWDDDFDNLTEGDITL